MQCPEEVEGNYLSSQRRFIGDIKLSKYDMAADMVIFRDAIITDSRPDYNIDYKLVNLKLTKYSIN